MMAEISLDPKAEPEPAPQQPEPPRVDLPEIGYVDPSVLEKEDRKFDTML